MRPVLAICLPVLLAIPCLRAEEPQPKPEPGGEAGPARASEPGQVPTIASLISTLGNEDYRAREQAAADLNRRWAESWEALLGQEDAQDLEIRTRVKRILGGFKFSHWVFCADLAAGRGNHQLERTVLLRAARLADRNEVPYLLFQLAFCHRGLRDYRKALAYYELFMAMHAEDASMLYCLAILQKNDDRISDALNTIDRALKLEPTKWNILMLKAGYSYLSGKREEGLKLFASIKPTPEEEATTFYQDMLAWSYAVTGQRERFFPQFERTLIAATAPSTFAWISQDADLDPYREDPRFEPLVKKHRERVYRQVFERMRTEADAGREE